MCESRCLGQSSFNFYRDLYADEGRHFIAPFILNFSPTLLENEVAFLNNPFFTKEIYKALFDITPFKVLGPDRFQEVFYQKVWNLISTFCLLIFTSFCEWW